MFVCLKTYRVTHRCAQSILDFVLSSITHPRACKLQLRPRPIAAENRLHGTPKDSLAEFNDTEMSAGRILINDLSVDSPMLSGNDRMGVDVEFSQCNEY